MRNDPEETGRSLTPPTAEAKAREEEAMATEK